MATLVSPQKMSVSITIKKDASCPIRSISNKDF